MTAATRALIVCTAALAGLAGNRQDSPLLLILNKQDATLAFVDPVARQVVGRTATGEGPHEIVVSSDGRTAFVSNYGAQTPGATLSVIDVESKRELRRVDLAPLRRPHGLAFAGGKVYFTAETNRAVGRYDPAANQVDWVLGTGQAGTHMVVAANEGTRLFTSNIGSNSISVLEQGQNPLAWDVTTIAVGAGPEGLDLAPGGNELWVAHSRDGGVSIIDAAAKKVVQTMDFATKRSNRLKFTPDGRQVLITDLDGGELVVVDAAARREIKRLKLGRSPEGILMEPGGSRAYVAVTGDNEVAIIDLKSLEVTGRIAPGAGPDGMAWSARR